VTLSVSVASLRYRFRYISVAFCNYHKPCSVTVTTSAILLMTF